MTTVERMIAERNRTDNEPLEVVQSDPFSYDIVGAASDDLNKYGGLASSALLEVASSAMKSKEDAAKAAAFANSDWPTSTTLMPALSRAVRPPMPCDRDPSSSVPAMTVAPRGTLAVKLSKSPPVTRFRSVSSAASCRDRQSL